MPNGFIKTLSGETIEIVDAQSRSDIEQLKDDVAGKLTEPNTGLAVGKYFRVASIDSDGHAVLEACDLPIASPSVLGVVMPSNARGLGVRASDGQMYLINTTEASIKARTKESYGGFGAINTGNIVTAVDSVLCSEAESEALTDMQKTNACARLGAVKKNGYVELINTTTTEDAMFTYSFGDNWYSSIIVRVCFPASGSGTTYKYTKMISDTGNVVWTYPTANANDSYAGWLYFENTLGFLKANFIRSLTATQETGQYFTNDRNHIYANFGKCDRLETHVAYPAGTNVTIWAKL